MTNYTVFFTVDNSWVMQLENYKDLYAKKSVYPISPDQDPALK